MRQFQQRRALRCALIWPNSGPRPATAIPAGQRATGESLHARLTAALKRNQQLADENARLRRQLARAFGDQRSARTRSGNDPAQ